MTFEIEGSGEIVATENGDPTNFMPFPAQEREAFNGLALVIMRARRGEPGSMTVMAKSPGLEQARVVLKSH